MPYRILTVEDAFDIKSWGGIVVVPGPLKSETANFSESATQQFPKIPASLLRPDGSEIEAVLYIQHVFQTPQAKEDRWTCTLLGISKEDVPIGTEIWIL